MTAGGNTGPANRGIYNVQAVLTNSIVSQIRTLYFAGYNKKEAYKYIYQIYNININTFSDV